MRLVHIFCALISMIGPSFADNTRAINTAARTVFDDMPKIKEVPFVEEHCGANRGANEDIFYCTNQKTIFIRAGFWEEPVAAYALAHMFGHAAQVEHGVATIAFGMIQADPQNEAVLRSMVPRQVECLAGFFFREAGLPRTSLIDLFEEEPFTGSHWGRDPVSNGPRVSIGLELRNEWFELGQGLRTPLDCTVEDLSAEPLKRGLR